MIPRNLTTQNIKRSINEQNSHYEDKHENAHISTEIIQLSRSTSMLRDKVKLLPAGQFYSLMTDVKLSQITCGIFPALCLI